MEKSVSSLKIFNLVVCALILLIFALLTSRLTVNADTMKYSDENVNLKVNYSDIKEK